MYVRVRHCQLNKDEVIIVTKFTSVADLKNKVSNSFGVLPEKQRLIFRGKQLEDEYTLLDYGVNLNDVIQLYERVGISTTLKEGGSDIQDSNKSYTNLCLKVEDNFTCRNYKIGDKVDVLEAGTGSWFEAIILSADATVIKTGKIADQKEQYCEIKFEGFEESEIVNKKWIRPMAEKEVSLDALQPNMKVLVNYNPIEPNNLGYWYDFIVQSTGNNFLKGFLIIGHDQHNLDVVLRNDQKIYLVDNSVIRDDNTRNAEETQCEKCKKMPSRKCKECGCYECGGKDDPDKQIMCDECDSAFHLHCIKPPLNCIPDVDHWYCHHCKNDDTEIVKAGEKLKESKKKNKNRTSNAKHLGGGMANVGCSKVCTIVPSDHFGPIPGIEVGTSWMYRIQVSESGVHRPPVSGIHGREKIGAFSIVLSGGYEDDEDLGESFWYTGSGGRDLSGNKRTSKQSGDQALDSFNKALARNCNVPLNINGAKAIDWKKGKPVRVVRTYKFVKHSNYAPKEGMRYDGIYKVVEYHPEVGKSGHQVWKFLLQRDDPTPAPWTPEGQALIKSLGLIMQVPEGHDEYMAKKAAELENKKKRKRKKTEEVDVSLKKQKLVEDSDKSNYALNANESEKVNVQPFILNQEILDAINLDVMNAKLWLECKDSLKNGKKKFLDAVEETFMCICCQDLVYNPVTTDCSHNFCKKCICRAFEAKVFTCPSCRSDLGEKYKAVVNHNLGTALIALFPGYGNS